MQIGSARMYKRQSLLRRLNIVFPILLGLLLVFAAPCWCQTHGKNNQQRTYERKHTNGNQQKAQKNRFEQPETAKQSSYGNNRLRSNERKWEGLPPQKQDELRRKMDTYKSLPPEDRTLYQKRFDQMQQLPPDERNDVRNKLRRMDRLSPEEKEEIRRKFE